jgi:putative membrane protein insertion efficiency factor
MTYLRWFWRGPALAVGWAMILCVLGYQRFFRPLLPPSCRFYPGCSEYFILSVRKHGPVFGSVKGVWRICRCNPWGGSGYDPP